MLICHTGEIIVTPQSHPGCKAWRKYGLLQLHLPICCQCHVIYFVVEILASSSPRGAGAGASDSFLIFFAASLFLHDFQLPCPSFVVPKVLPRFFSSLLPQLFSFTELNRESFYSILLPGKVSQKVSENKAQRGLARKENFVKSEFVEIETHKYTQIKTSENTRQKLGKYYLQCL